MYNGWILTKVKEFYESDPRSCSTESRWVDLFKCPCCNKTYPRITCIAEANFCPNCGEPLGE